MDRSHHNTILTGIVDSYCLVCETYLRSDHDITIHIQKPIHIKKLSTTPFKDEEHRIRKVPSGYYCQYCNKLLTLIAQVALHTQESYHNNNRALEIVRREGDSIIAYDDICISKKAWNGYVEENYCILCNTRIDNEEQHLTEQMHCLNVVQKKVDCGINKSIYRNIDKEWFHCLTCNIGVPTSMMNSHFESTDHIDLCKKSHEINKGNLVENNADEKGNLTKIKPDVKEKLVQKETDQNETLVQNLGDVPEKLVQSQTDIKEKLLQKERDQKETLIKNLGDVPEKLVPSQTGVKEKLLHKETDQKETLIQNLGDVPEKSVPSQTGVKEKLTKSQSDVKGKLVQEGTDLKETQKKKASENDKKSSNMVLSSDPPNKTAKDITKQNDNLPTKSVKKADVNDKITPTIVVPNKPLNKIAKDETEHNNDSLTKSAKSAQMKTKAEPKKAKETSKVHTKANEQNDEYIILHSDAYVRICVLCSLEMDVTQVLNHLNSFHHNKMLELHKKYTVTSKAREAAILANPYKIHDKKEESPIPVNDNGLKKKKNKNKKEQPAQSNVTPKQTENNPKPTVETKKFKKNKNKGKVPEETKDTLEKADKVPQKETNEQLDRNIEPETVPMNSYLKMVTIIKSEEDYPYIVLNDNLMAPLEGFHMINDLFGKSRCDLCDISETETEQAHVNTEGHVVNLGLSLVHKKYDDELLRELPSRSLFHCGFCNHLEPEMGLMEDHLQSIEHQEVKRSLAWRLYSASTEIKQLEPEKIISGSVLNVFTHFEVTAH